MRAHRFLVTGAATLQAQGESAREHVPPEPPASHVHSMSYGEMAGMMGMDDRRHFFKVMFDRLEWQESSDGSQFEWNAAAWYGGDVNKLWLETRR